MVQLEPKTQELQELPQKSSDSTQQNLQHLQEHRVAQTQFRSAQIQLQKCVPSFHQTSSRTLINYFLPKRTGIDKYVFQFAHPESCPRQQHRMCPLTSALCMCCSENKRWLKCRKDLKSITCPSCKYQISLQLDGRIPFLNLPSFRQYFKSLSCISL